MKRAIILTVRKTLEFNMTTIYRWAFIGEVIDAIESTNLWEVDVYDGGVVGATLDDYVEKFRLEYDLVLFYTDPHVAHEVLDLSRICKEISPRSKIMIYGRTAVFIPQYFKREPIDAIHLSGDRELVIRDYALNLSGQKPTETLSGIWLLERATKINIEPGPRFNGGKWFFPNLTKLPIEDYKKISKKKGRLFEYALSVSKGCPNACPYCETTTDQGRIDRRRDIHEIITWINTKIYDQDDWIIQLWSSNFFHDHGWVMRFCNAYKGTKSTFRWRAVGSFRDITAEVVSKISEANCYEVAFGVETISVSQKKSPKGPLEKLLKAIDLCRNEGIRVKCLLLLNSKPNTGGCGLYLTVATKREYPLSDHLVYATP